MLSLQTEINGKLDLTGEVLDELEKPETKRKRKVAGADYTSVIGHTTQFIPSVEAARGENKHN